MKICIVCSHGGHLTEMLHLIEYLNDNELFFITYHNLRTENLKHKKYLIKNIGTNPYLMTIAFIKTFEILIKEKPVMIISTGSEIAIPAFILSRVLNIKNIFIESWCRINTKSGTGSIVYPFSDIFLVQWPQLLEKYGKKAKYVGAVV